MGSLGYDNVTIIHGDGTKGLPASEPFDAIIAAASGPDVPKEMTRQLAIGGRLVMPVGEPPSIKKLLGVTPVGAVDLEHEVLGVDRTEHRVGYVCATKCQIRG